MVTPPVLAEDSFFWVGVERATAGGVTQAAGQMFVLSRVPAERRHRWPVVMVHGGGGQGLDWLGTPDGRPGWADAFLHRGHAVCVVDRPGHGRAPHHAPSRGAQTPPPGYEMMWARFTAPEQRPESYAEARLHTQWPDGEAVLDQFMAGQGPMGMDLALAHQDMRRAAVALLDRLGPAVLLTHSAGAAFGWLAADACPDLVKALVAIEPLGPPFAQMPTGTLHWGLTASPLHYDPPAAEPAELRPVPHPAPRAGWRDSMVQAEPPRRLPNLGRCPMAVVTAEASWKAREDHGVVDYLRQAGAAVDHLRLEEHGLHGNGHMMMLEKNSDAIAALVAGWIEARV